MMLRFSGQYDRIPEVGVGRVEGWGQPAFLDHLRGKYGFLPRGEFSLVLPPCTSHLMTFLISLLHLLMPPFSLSSHHLLSPLSPPSVRGGMITCAQGSTSPGGALAGLGTWMRCRGVVPFVHLPAKGNKE